VSVETGIVGCEEGTVAFEVPKPPEVVGRGMTDGGTPEFELIGML
jgi:hypothetical protein